MARARAGPLLGILIRTRQLPRAGATAGVEALASAVLNAPTACGVFVRADRLHRGFAAEAADGGGTAQTRVLNTQSLLDSLQAAKLRDELGELSRDKPFVTYAELIDVIKQSGAADSDSEAEERANALTRAGVILRLSGVVYLRPEEIAEMVYRIVPTDPTEARARLAATEAQIANMEQQHRAIQHAATRWPRFWLQMGFLALGVQLVGFVYLTYWELSWDVMEPIAYMLSLTYSWLAYLYFLFRGSTLDYEPFLDHWTGQQLNKKISQRGFDLERYQSLVRQGERLRRHLAAQAAAEADGHKL